MYWAYEKGKVYDTPPYSPQSYVKKSQTVGTWSYKCKRFIKRTEIYNQFMKIKSWQTWSPYIITTVCSTCMAAGFGNIYRLPQAVILRGGLPFLAVYLGLTIFLGLPLLFLELGIGQLVQEGVIKFWRAVPFFKGIGYVKLLMCCLLSIYYPLYIGMSLFYVIWIFRGPLPFQECSSRVKMTDAGYMPDGKDGQTCLKSTFLKSPFEQPYWYGVFIALLLAVWIIITTMLSWKTKSYIRSLLFLILPMLACYIFLIVKSVMFQGDQPFLHTIFSNTDWSLLRTASIWYYASVQVFFSTSIGFGTFVTNAGIIYNKVNPFWTAIGYLIISTLFGFGSVVISQAMLNETNNNSSDYPVQISEVELMASIYNIGIANRNEEMKIWIIVFYSVIFLSGLISMATLIYTLLKTICVQTKNRWKWWHLSILVNFTGYLLGCLGLLVPNFGIAHLLDHYIVGNLVMVATVIEILALISFYGVDRIKTDFEFIVGHILSRMWLLLWWTIPLFLTAMFAWAMITLPLEGIHNEDPSWLYGIGWGVVLSATFFIFVVGYFVVTKQDGYTFKDKFKASVKPTNNWGPKDPISRLNWIQWSTKAQQGEKDFTLKRKGTRDYTRSVKKNKKIQSQAPSQLSTASIQGVYKPTSKSNTNGSNIYAEVPERFTPNQRFYNSPINTQRVTSFPSNNTVSSLEMSRYGDNNLRGTSLPNSYNLYTSSPLNKSVNPLSQTNRMKSKFEENGSLRKGPYIISDNEVDHICFRQYSENNDVSEL